MNLTLFEGCLRNRKALCRELALPDGAEEAAVIEAGYRRWGAALPDRLYGAFAFAFHDPESGAFFCARDPVGLQPFFYCVTEKREFLFGCDINDLASDPRYRRALDPQALQYYMQLGYPAGARTLWRGIRKLMPGQCLTFRDGECRITTYYRPAYRPDAAPTEEEWAEEIDALLSRVIDEDRENVDFSAACSFLSGGLDSSYLLALTGVPRAVGVGFRGEAASETPQAAETARMLGAAFSEVDVSPEGFLDAVPRLVRRTGLPLADASAVAFTVGCERAARYGAACFSGEGADEFFAGYRIYSQAEKLGHTGGPWHYGCAGVMTDENAARLLMQEAPFPSAPLVRPLYEETEGCEHLSRLLRIDCALWLEGDILFGAHCSARAAGLKLLLPYADRRVFELSARIPSALKWKDGVEKYILRRAAEKRLPAETAYRPKAGFPVPVREWLRRDPFRRRVEETLFSPLSARFFDQALLRGYWTRFQAGNGIIWQIPYAAYVFLTWAREYGI